jgi:hypothetical protein
MVKHQALFLLTLVIVFSMTGNQVYANDSIEEDAIKAEKKKAAV